METTHDDDENISRRLRCNFDCVGETSHRFVSFEGMEDAVAFENPDLPLSELEETNRQEDGFIPGQPIWECEQCDSPRYGPDPRGDSEDFSSESESESESSSRPDRNLTNRDKYESSVFNRPQNHLEAITVKKLLDEFRQQGSYDESEVIEKVKSEANFPVTAEKIEQAIHNLTFNDHSDEPRKPPTLLETEVLAVMRELDTGDGIETAILIAKIKDRWDISTADVETAIEGVLYRGECYEINDETLIPV